MLGGGTTIQIYPMKMALSVIFKGKIRIFLGISSADKMA
jgi:hypothetical protein